MQAPPEVWEKITRHFRVFLSQDANDAVRAKKRTLLALALTHPKLTDIALNEHWRSVLTLKPVVNVVNNSSRILQKDQSDCWVS